MSSDRSDFKIRAAGLCKTLRRSGAQAVENQFSVFSQVRFVHPTGEPTSQVLGREGAAG